MTPTAKLGVLTAVSILGLLAVTYIATILNLPLYGIVAVIVMYFAYVFVLWRADRKFRA